MTDLPRLSLPELILLPASAAEANRFDPASDRVVHEWKTVAGEVIAYSAERAGRDLMHLEGVATYGFVGESGRVEAAAEPGVMPARVEDGYYRAVLPFVLHSRGTQSIHASAVDSAAGVILICGVSGSGKSTLAYGLSRRGLPVFADDVVAFHPDSDPVVVSPLPFAVRLMPDAAALYFQTSDHQGAKFSPPVEADADSPPSPLALGLALSAERASKAPMEVRPLAPADALTVLLSHAYCFDPDRISRKEPMVRDYMSLAAKVPFFQVTLGTGLGELDERLERLEEFIGTEFGMDSLALGAAKSR